MKLNALALAALLAATGTAFAAESTVTKTTVRETPSGTVTRQVTMQKHHPVRHVAYNHRHHHRHVVAIVKTPPHHYHHVAKVTTVRTYPAS